MIVNKYISIEDFSAQENLELQLLRDFAENGLITIYVVEEKDCLLADDLDEVGRLVRLYKDLHINIEGIDIILTMRKQLIELNRKLEQAQYRLQKLEQEKQMLYFELPRNSGLIIDVS